MASKKKTTEPKPRPMEAQPKPAPSAPSAAAFPVSEGLDVRQVVIEELKEQETNAHVMPPVKFEQLVANIKERGALESMPYCSQPNGVGPVTIVSGHHRVRAAHQAGLRQIPAMVDMREMTKAQMVSRVLAHNKLVGHDDDTLLRELLGQLDTPEDMLRSGFADDLLVDDERDGLELFTPNLGLHFKTLSFAFLGHQMDDFDQLLGALDGKQDLVLVGMEEQFKEFLVAASKFGRFKDIRSGGTVIAVLTKIALALVEQGEEEEKAATAQP